MSNDSWLTGDVIRGDGRGRQLGFPTANLDLLGDINLPAEGVYAGVARLNDNPKRYRAAIHIGPVPTFNKDTQTMEVYLLDFPDRDLYGEVLHITIRDHIRPISKFDSIETLITAIRNDCEHVRSIIDL